MSSSTTPAEVHRLWRRAAFGIDAAGAEARAGRPWDELVDELISPEPAPMARPAELDDPALAGAGEFFRALAVSGAWLDHMATTPTPGVEKLTWFWHGHFTTSMAKVVWGEGLHRQLTSLRTRATGPFRDLLGELAVDSAMGFWLDNVGNVAGANNENLARELLELFTVGVGNHTQTDVTEAARCLTGHNVDWDGSMAPRFYPSLHDGGTKTVLGSTGAFDAHGLCDVICNDTNRVLVARTVARKLWEAWAAPAPSAALVDDLAQRALADGFTGRAFARAVLLHPEYRSTAAQTQLVRSPVEIAVAVAKLAGTTPSALGALQALAEADHLPFMPPNVSGWPPARDLLSARAWWQLGPLHSTAAFHAAWTAPAPIPTTAAMAPADAARAGLRWAGIPEPSPATVDGIAAYVTTIRQTTPAWEPVALAMAVTLSPDFAA